MSATDSVSGTSRLSDFGLDPGVEFVAELGRGAQAVVYRIRRHGIDYALKALPDRAIGDERATVAFSREAALLARIDHPAVPRVFEVGGGRGRPYLIMEYVAGRPLSALVAEGPLDEERLAHVGADVAGALAVAHRAGLVHRDVKPANILITPDGRARVIDFGLAAADQPGAESDAVAGTLDYSAPEQTGMLARPVDGRADLYALGVVLFECATGVLPYTSGDVGELIQMHASAPVPDPRTRRPDLSARLAALVMRLLAKDPDDRYATAEQVYAELAGPDRAAGLGAATDAGLVGRDTERDELVRRWVRARGGAGAFALVVGAAGVGKTRLADAVAGGAARDGALVLTGRCAADDSVPLAALRSAVDRYARNVAALPEPGRAEAVTRLRTAAGAGSHLLAPLSGALASLLGVPVAAVDDRHDQFTAAVAAFFAELARAHGGLVVQLDDVHWLDPTVGEVLRQLADEIADAPLFVLATARADETGEEAAAFRAACGDRLEVSLRLGPLDERAVARLVSGYLAGGEVSRELTAELSARGHGNPFTVLEYLRALIDAGALRPSWGTWLLDAERLHAITLPGDVLDLLLARIDGLGGAARHLLTTAAAIGPRFPADLLADIEQVDPTPELAEAVTRGVLHAAADGYTFAHDRIREALLSTLDQIELRARHQRIATVLDGRSATGSAAVYALARHYALGETDRNPERVFATGTAAGRLALAEQAPVAAIGFLEPARAAAELAGITPDGQFREALGSAYYGAGRLDEAEREFDAGLVVATHPNLRASLMTRLASLHRADFRPTRSLEFIRQGLGELGHRVPHGRFALILETIVRLVWWVLTGWRVGRQRALRRPATGARRERIRLTSRLYLEGVTVAGTALRPDLAGWFAMHNAKTAAKLGPSAEYALSRLPLIGIASLLRMERRRAKLVREAFDIIATLHDPKVNADATWANVVIDAIFRGGSKDVLLRTVEEQRRWLDPDDYLNIVMVGCEDFFLRGYPREALALHKRGGTRVPDLTVLTVYQGGTTVAEAMLGHPVDVDALVTDCDQDAEPARRLHRVMNAVMCAVEEDELGASFETAAEAVDRIGISPHAMIAEHRMLYLYLAYGRLAQARRAVDAERPERLAAAAAAVKRCQRMTREPLLKAYHAVARAELATLQGDYDAGLRLLVTSEPLIARVDAPLVEYEAARVRARALSGLSLIAGAERQARTALALAVEYDWVHRARWVRSEFGVGGPSARQTGSRSRQTSVTDDRYRRRLEALQQISHAAATVLDPEQLARVALDETLRILGAERALLFLTDAAAQLRPTLGRDANRQDVAELSGYSATLVDRVAESREPLVVTGTEEGEALGSRSALLYGLRSIMIAPLEWEGRLLGVVYLDSRVAKGVFTERDIDLLTAVSSHIAVSLETARAAQLEVAVQAARQQRDVAETLRAAMAELSATLDPEEVARTLLAIVGRLAPADQVRLVRAEDGTALLGMDAPRRDDTRYAADVRTLLGEAGSWVAVPLRTHAAGHGILLVGAAEPDVFGDEHVELIAAVAGQGSTAYDNAHLYAQVQQLATTDPLTGLSNRRHFAEHAVGHLAVARRNGRPLTAAMIDIDHFKKINDSYGHATGDDVIRAVASVLRANVREPDIVGRHGGEEFAVVMTEMHGDPIEVCERLRTAIAATTVDSPTGPIRATVSIGVAELKPDDDLDALLARADEALYRAKQDGRNQVKVG